MFYIEYHKCEIYFIKHITAKVPIREGVINWKVKKKFDKEIKQETFLDYIVIYCNIVRRSKKTKKFKKNLNFLSKIAPFEHFAV